MLTYSGQIKLVDFGIAKASTLESVTTDGSIRGKFAYMSPELIRGEKLDNRVDIFSMGVVLYRVLLGKMPFKGGQAIHRFHEVRLQKTGDLGKQRLYDFYVDL